MTILVRRRFRINIYFKFVAIAIIEVIVIIIIIVVGVSFVIFLSHLVTAFKCITIYLIGWRIMRIIGG